MGMIEQVDWRDMVRELVEGTEDRHADIHR